MNQTITYIALPCKNIVITEQFMIKNGELFENSNGLFLVI